MDTDEEVPFVFWIIICVHRPFICGNILLAASPLQCP
jgi:hypothetical protein